MFIVLLTFSEHKAKAGALIEGHNAWIRRGFDDGVFLLVGSVQPNRGGAIMAHRTSRPELQRRVDEDPFVAEGVVSAQVLELSPAKADERLSFLLD